MRIKVINKSKHLLTQYSTEASAGMEIRAQIRPRSGLAIKNGVTILNSRGTTEADYRGEDCIIVVNLMKGNFVIGDGERIHQMIITKHEMAEWISAENLLDTEKGSGGFGHTGNK